MVKIMKSSVVTICLLGSTNLRAEVPNKLGVDPETWGQKWAEDRTGDRTTEGAMMTRIIAVKKGEGALEIVPVDGEALNKLSYLETPDEAAIRLAIETNKPIISGVDNAPNPCLSKMEVAAACLGADAVLDISSGTWILYFVSPSGAAPKGVVKGPAGSPDKISKWVVAQLRHDGVILDEKDGVFLARVPATEQSSDLQALTLKNSANQFVLPAESSKGSALLISVAAKGRYGLFKFMTGEESVRPGTKFIFEKAKQIPKENP